jgi:hypothetical protein
MFLTWSPKIFFEDAVRYTIELLAEAERNVALSQRLRFGIGDPEKTNETPIPAPARLSEAKVHAHASPGRESVRGSIPVGPPSERRKPSWNARLVSRTGPTARRSADT